MHHVPCHETTEGKRSRCRQQRQRKNQHRVTRQLEDQGNRGNSLPQCATSGNYNDWKEAEFFDELPAHLRGEVAAYLMAEVFDQSDFFRYTSSASLQLLQP